MDDDRIVASKYRLNTHEIWVKQKSLMLVGTYGISIAINLGACPVPGGRDDEQAGGE